MRSFIYRLFSRLERRIDRAYNRYHKWKTREYLVANNVDFCDFEDYIIPSDARIYATTKLRIGKGLIMGNRSVIDSNDSFGIYIGNNLLLASDVYIRGSNHDWSYSEEPFQKRGHCAKRISRKGEDWSIVIEDNVWCGHGATILSGSYIRKGSVIGAGAVVTGEIPEYSVVIGNPYQVVSNRKKHMNWTEEEGVGIFHEV